MYTYISLPPSPHHPIYNPEKILHSTPPFQPLTRPHLAPSPKTYTTSKHRISELPKAAQLRIHHPAELSLLRLSHATPRHNIRRAPAKAHSYAGRRNRNAGARCDLTPHAAVLPSRRGCVVSGDDKRRGGRRRGDGMGQRVAIVISSSSLKVIAVQDVAPAPRSSARWPCVRGRSRV